MVDSSEGYWKFGGFESWACSVPKVEGYFFMTIFLVVDSTSSGVSLFLSFPFVSCKAEDFWQHDWGSGCEFANRSAVDLQIDLGGLGWVCKLVWAAVAALL